MPKAAKRNKSSERGHDATAPNLTGASISARRAEAHHRASQLSVQAEDWYSRGGDDDDVRPHRNRPKRRQPPHESNIVKKPLSIYVGEGSWKSYERSSTSSASIGATTTTMITPRSSLRLLRSAEWVRDHYLTTRLEDFWAVSKKGERIRVPKLRGVGHKEGSREGVLLLVRKGLLEQRGWEAHVQYVPMQRSQDEKDKGLILLRMTDAEGLEKVGKCRIASSHYSSLPTCAPIRQQQYRQTLRLVQQKPLPRSSVILGDFNANSELELSPFLASKVVDTHLKIRKPPHHPDFHEDPAFGHLYPFVPGHQDRKPRKPRRIDRIYLGGESSKLPMGTGERLGIHALLDDRGRDLEDANGDKVYPSDHEGFLVEVGLGQ
ncbi:BQ2448_941 [Microbotryum intermedium]|uniref:BQ2448_941 protein n=1 Tax=Microbotryum intermedium TaxID=269621 RepID=A0A238F473_9BASI|nr:BQ2448_941 [Microbotryum intermedium]